MNVKNIIKTSIKKLFEILFDLFFCFIVIVIVFCYIMLHIYPGLYVGALLPFKSNQLSQITFIDKHNRKLYVSIYKDWLCVYKKSQICYLKTNEINLGVDNDSNCQLQNNNKICFYHDNQIIYLEPMNNYYLKQKLPKNLRIYFPQFLFDNENSVSYHSNALIVIEIIRLFFNIFLIFAIFDVSNFGIEIIILSCLSIGFTYAETFMISFGMYDQDKLNNSLYIIKIFLNNIFISGENMCIVVMFLSNIISVSGILYVAIFHLAMNFKKNYICKNRMYRINDFV